MRAKPTFEEPRRGIFRPAARGFRRDQTGTSAIEFAILAAPFFAFLLLILELAIVYLIGQALENATQESARLVRTGQADTFSLQSFAKDVCDRMTAIPNCEKNLRIDVRVVPDFKTAAGLPTPTVDGKDRFGFDAGRGNDIVLVRTYYDWSGSPALPALIKFGIGERAAVTAANTYTLNAAAVFRNEPFS
jgi:Flp pilus assembly protein TadG